MIDLAFDSIDSNKVFTIFNHLLCSLHQISPRVEFRHNIACLVFEPYSYDPVTLIISSTATVIALDWSDCVLSGENRLGVLISMVVTARAGEDWRLKPIVQSNLHLIDKATLLGYQIKWLHSQVWDILSIHGEQ